ncbi:MAG: isopenicillin N synthase family oxygenase [Legionellales bacterium]|nr:isopenicillin N synthase family oxygenase [Legionellales bacterium]
MEVKIIDYRDSSAPKNFVQSLVDTGFVILINHPIKKEVTQSVYSEWKNFFHSSEKYDYLRDRETGEGYVPLEIENAKTKKLADLKEFYHFYQWGRRPKHIDLSSTDELFDSLLNLGGTLLEWIAINTPKNINELLSEPLINMINGSDQNMLRPIHYPPITNDMPEGAVRSAPHEDINLLTLFPASTKKGLQLKDSNGWWYEPPLQEDSIIVNTADMLQMCSGGYYRSTTHRVNNPPSKENVSRYALAFFLHARSNVVLSQTGYTAHQYLQDRIKEIGLDRNLDEYKKNGY